MCDKGPFIQTVRFAVKRHVSDVQEVRSLLSPKSLKKVLEEEIRALRSEEKQIMILTKAKVTLDIDAKTGLAMKAALGMPGINLGF